MAEDHEWTVNEAGRKGGVITRDRYGAPFFQANGRLGGHAVAEKYGREHYVELGRKGGQAAYARHGAEFYAKIGCKGGEAVKARFEPGYYQRIGRLGKGRHTPATPRVAGPGPGRRALTQEQARELRQRHLAGEGLALLGREYGVPYASAKQIVMGLTYREP